MPNILLNPAFEDGVEHWENGPDYWPPFDEWDPVHHWIRGDSPGTNSDFKPCTIQQLFTIGVLGVPVSAKLTAWRRYESVGGYNVDGVVISRIKLQKPDTTWVTIVEETKTALTGEGNILDQENVLSHFSQQGNYKFMLQSEVRSAYDRTNHEIKVEEPYGPWTNNGFTIDDPNCKVYSNADNQNEVYAKIEKNFVVDAACHIATLWLDAKGFRQTCELPGYAKFKVTLTQVGMGFWVLYDNYLYDGNWTTILNALDITSCLSEAGTYNLKLEAWVTSGWNGEATYYPSQAWFGNCELNAQWYSYSYIVSKGYWDDLNLDIIIGETEVKTKLDGVWKSSQVQVKVGGVWKPAKAWVKVNGIWR